MNKLIPLNTAAGLLAIGLLTTNVQAALVGEWTFDSQTLANTGTTGSTHDGTFNGGTVAYSTDTQSGSGFSLDLTAAGDYMTINNSASGDASYASTFDGSTFTVSMWVKNTDATWTQWSEFAGKGNETNGEGWALRARDWSGHAQAGTRFNSYSDGSVARDTSPFLADITDTQWHLLTATYDGSEMNLYIDGVLGGTDSTATIADTSVYSLVFGARDDGSRGESILIDSIQYYDEALSSLQVAALIPEPSAFAFLSGITGLAFVALRRRR